MRKSKNRIVVLAGLALVVVGALVSAHLQNTARDKDQLVNAAVDQVFFQRHRYFSDPDLIRPAIRQWHEQFRQYTPEIAYHGADRATVTFRSGGRTVARAEMHRYAQGMWMRPIPFRRRRFQDPYYPPQSTAMPPSMMGDGVPQNP